MSYIPHLQNVSGTRTHRAAQHSGCITNRDKLLLTRATSPCRSPSSAWLLEARCFPSEQQGPLLPVNKSTVRPLRLPTVTQRDPSSCKSSHQLPTHTIGTCACYACTMGSPIHQGGTASRAAQACSLTSHPPAPLTTGSTRVCQAASPLGS